jgi:hypothetical protein
VHQNASVNQLRLVADDRQGVELGEVALFSTSDVGQPEQTRLGESHQDPIVRPRRDGQVGEHLTRVSVTQQGPVIGDDSTCTCGYKKSLEKRIVLINKLPSTLDALLWEIRRNLTGQEVSEKNAGMWNDSACMSCREKILGAPVMKVEN